MPRFIRFFTGLTLMIVLMMSVCLSAFASEPQHLFEFEYESADELSVQFRSFDGIFEITDPAKKVEMVEHLNHFTYTANYEIPAMGGWTFVIQVAAPNQFIEYFQFNKNYVRFDTSDFPGHIVYENENEAPLTELFALLQTISDSWLEHEFSDVRFDTWYSDPVYSCAAEGVISGYEDGTFRPDAQLTRAEAVKLIAAASGLEVDASEKAAFADSAEHWATSYIAAAVEAGVVNGYGDGTFRPDAPITRAELVKLIAAAKGLDGTGNTPFVDCESHWAAGNLAAAFSAGIINGYEDGTFRPDKDISRCEAAKMIAFAFVF